MQEPNSAEQRTSYSSAASSAANNVLWSLAGRQTTSEPPLPTPQSIFSNPAIQPTSVVNLSNSSDVVIGPMTQYQGAVTIYQYMDATVESRSMQANGGGGINQSRSTNSTLFTQKLTNTSKWLIALIVLALVVAGIIVYFEVTRRTPPDVSSENIYFGNNYEHDTFPNLGNGHLVVDRQQWGSSEVANKLTVPLEHPIPYVLITHIGAQSAPCYNIYKCSIKMRTIQDSAISEENLPDIKSNFYVGSDGNVYVGRGWNFANTYANSSLAITFMGDFESHQPTDKQIEATQYLLAHASTNKYIDLDYKLVARNQTRQSKSPGANVYHIIKNWPHFYPCSMNGNPKCGSELGISYPWQANM